MAARLSRLASDSQVLVASLRALGRLVAALKSEALNLASLRLVKALGRKIDMMSFHQGVPGTLWQNHTQCGAVSDPGRDCRCLKKNVTGFAIAAGPGT